MVKYNRILEQIRGAHSEQMAVLRNGRAGSSLTSAAAHFKRLAVFKQK